MDSINSLSDDLTSFDPNGSSIHQDVHNPISSVNGKKEDKYLKSKVLGNVCPPISVIVNPPSPSQSFDSNEEKDRRYPLPTTATFRRHSGGSMEKCIIQLFHTLNFIVSMQDLE